MKHTPGPWEVSEEWHGDLYIDSYIEGEGDTALAKIVNNVCKTDQAEANARLIAAAPDLLEACKEALNVLEDWDDLNQPDDGPEWLFVTAMKDAIAKAQGV